MSLVDDVVEGEELRNLGLRHAALGAATSALLHELKSATAVVHAGTQLLQQPLSVADHEVVLADLRRAAGEAEQLIRVLSRIARLDVPRLLVDVTAHVEHLALALHRVAGTRVDVELEPGLGLACVPEAALARALAAAIVGARGPVVVVARGEGHERVSLEVRGEVEPSRELRDATRALEAVGVALTIGPSGVRFEVPAFNPVAPTR